MDEVEFYPGQDKKMTQSKIMDIYRTVKRRMESRYMKLGELPGKLFLISSKKSEYDFLEQYIGQVKSSSNIKVIDEPLWNVKPAKNYSGDKMIVAVGNKYLTSKILDEGEDVEKYKKQGYRIIEVPVEHRDAFELDINAALMDIAGLAISSTTKFIYSSRLLKCIDQDRPNPFTKDNIVISFDDVNTDIRDYLDVDKIDRKDLSKPCYAHIDTSKNGDRTGLSLICVEGQAKTMRLEDGEVFEVVDLVYKTVLTVTLEAEKGSEIPFYKIREFYYYLRDELGANIRRISADGYQSVDMIQQFNLRGFNSKTISLDRSTDPYHVFRTAVNEGRFDMYPHEILEDELINLEEDNVNQKIDHPLEGSKDLSDSVAGAVYSASIDDELNDIVTNTIDIDKILTTLEDLSGKRSFEEDMKDSMEKELIADSVSTDKDEKDKNKQKSVIDDKTSFDKIKTERDMNSFIESLLD